jgi:hypothetical protein
MIPRLPSLYRYRTRSTLLAFAVLSLSTDATLDEFPTDFIIASGKIHNSEGTPTSCSKKSIHHLIDSLVLG